MWRPDLQSAAFYDRTARVSPWLERATALVDGVDQTVERRRLLDRLGVEPDHRVLEVAVGTCANGRFVDERLGPRGSFVGADASQVPSTGAGGGCGRLRVGAARSTPPPHTCRSGPTASTRCSTSAGSTPSLTGRGR